MKRRLLFLFVAVLAFVSYGETVIGNWEFDTDGWNGITPGQTVGVTRDNYSGVVVQSGWGQSFSKSLNAAEKAAFMANDTFSIDFSVAANDGTITAGYSEIYSISLNASGAGWQDFVPPPDPWNFYWWEGSGERTQTVTIDYSAYKSLITPDPGYIEIIFALNTGDGAPPEMYFDNAILTPEPMTVALLGLGGLFLRRRK